MRYDLQNPEAVNEDLAGELVSSGRFLNVSRPFYRVFAAKKTYMHVIQALKRQRLEGDPSFSSDIFSAGLAILG